MRIVVATAVMAGALVSCSESSQPQAAPSPTAGSQDPAVSSPSPSPSPSPSSPAPVEWRPGPSSEFAQLATGYIVDEDPSNDAQAWAKWLSCDPDDAVRDQPAIYGCKIDTGHGPARALVINWYALGDAEADSSTAIMAEVFGGAEAYANFCVGGDTVVSAPLAPGYVLLVLDPALDNETRFDTATDVADAAAHAVLAEGMADAGERPTAQVIRCDD